MNLRKDLNKNKNVYPNFLGIGSVRGGSTWLYKVLNSHPQIMMPKYRKEIQYFTRYYKKSISWYLSYFNFFSYNEFKYIGEFTPGYLSNSNAAERIFNLGHIEKFILILRDPIERTFSQYLWHLNNNNTELSFEEFYRTHHHIAIENSLYFKNLKKYFEFFDPRDFLILIFEECVDNNDFMIQEIANFLEINPEKFIIPSKSNQSFTPKSKPLYILLRKLNNKLRQIGLNFFSNFVIDQLNFKKYFTVKKHSFKPNQISPDDQFYLSSIFKQDISSLENHLGRKISYWKIYE